MSDERLRARLRIARTEPTEENLARLGAEYMRSAEGDPQPQWRLSFGYRGYGVYGQGETPEEAAFHAFYHAAKDWSPGDQDTIVNLTWERWDTQWGFQKTTPPDIMWDDFFNNIESLSKAKLSFQSMVLAYFALVPAEERDPQLTVEGFAHAQTLDDVDGNALDWSDQVLYDLDPDPEG